MRHYRSFIQDSTRWDGFELRDGDIIISTPAKSGTTWMQMCVALVLFQTPELPRPMAELSPWLDMLTRPRDEVVALLEAQEHRRFIKTHTPLDGLPEDPRVTYICVGRDPRDVMRSWENHVANADIERIIVLRERAVGLDDLDPADMPTPPPEDPVERFWAWVDLTTSPPETVQGGLAGVLHHLQTFWERRDRPNVHLFHYGDLQADLPSQLRRLAEVLHVDVPEDRWDELVPAASFTAMKERADVLAPDTVHDLWKSNSQFFDQGRSGRWREWLSDDDMPRYDARVAELVEPDLARWAHHGWLGA